MLQCSHSGSNYARNGGRSRVERAVVLAWVAHAQSLAERVMY